MPPLDSPRQEKFVQLAVTGMPLVKAYEEAGYEAHTSNASRLSAKEPVKERMIELQRKSTDLALITVASLVDRADELRELAIEHKQISAGVAAVKEIGILTGLRIDRREIGEPGEFARLSDDELVKMIEGSVELIELPADET